MKTHRELLEAAAKAAGLDVDFRREDSELGVPFRGTATWWNPLTDDGDALRLAVKLKLMVNIGGVLIDGVQVQSPSEPVIVVEPYSQGPHVATRRAIVRAAAMIGDSP